MRQRPQSANGTLFVTLEDEAGQTNVIVWESVARTYRQALLNSRLLEVHGTLQRENHVQHVIAKRLVDRSYLVGTLQIASRDFH